MSSQPAAQRVVRFGLFELDVSAGELRRQGRRIKLQDQPLQVLELLLSRPGEVVTREELQKALWPTDTFVEFDQGLNTAIKKIRLALGDSADNPRFVETIPRKGYRFIAPVEPASQQANVNPPTPQRSHRLIWIAAAITIAIAGTLVTVALRTPPIEPAERVVPLTTYAGTQDSPSFSPDGTQVAFAWCKETEAVVSDFVRRGKNCGIYIKQIGVEPPFGLTVGMDHSPAWSPDGRFVAFLREASPSKFQLILIPQRGGRERVLAETAGAWLSAIPGPYLAWTPDSKWLAFPKGDPVSALFLLSVDTQELRRLTMPPSEATGDGDTNPAFSPDGRTLAFARFRDNVSLADLYTLPIAVDYRPQGEPVRLQPANAWNFAPAWTPDGKEIIFSSNRGTVMEAGLGLWRVKASRQAMPRRLAFASGEASGPAVSRQLNRLAYVEDEFDTNIWRIDLPDPGSRPSPPAQFIASTRPEFMPAFSPDGKKIAFVSARSGAHEIWVCNSDGSNLVQLTSFAGPKVGGEQWSWDGQSIVFAVINKEEELYVISANGGAPHRLATPPGGGKWPYWSRDGQSLYFASGNDVWKMRSTGGGAVQITRNGGDVPQESPDGKFVYYEKGWPGPRSVWRIPVGGGEETEIFNSVNPSTDWTVGPNGIYFFKVADDKGCSDLCLYEFATAKTRKLLTVERGVSYGLTVSPDGRTILYTQLDEAGSDLMLVENFR